MRVFDVLLLVERCADLGHRGRHSLAAILLTARWIVKYSLSVGKHTHRDKPTKPTITAQNSRPIRVTPR